MTVNFNNKKLDLHYSYEVSVIYENMTQHSIDYDKMTSQDYEILFYGVLLSTLRYNKIGKMIISFVDFKNWVDDNGGTKLFVEFIKWYVDTVKAEFEMLKNEIEEPEEPIDESEQLKNVSWLTNCVNIFV